MLIESSNRKLNLR
jgi:hypothetical protein